MSVGHPFPLLETLMQPMSLKIPTRIRAMAHHGMPSIAEMEAQYIDKLQLSFNPIDHTHAPCTCMHVKTNGRESHAYARSTVYFLAL